MRYSACLIFLLTTSVCSAGVIEKIAACDAIKDVIVSASCVDEVGKSVGVRGINDAGENIGNWFVSKNQTTDDGTQVATAILSAFEKVTINNKKVIPTVFIGCIRGKTRTMVSWDSFIGNDETRILIKLDDEKPVIGSWTILADHTSASPPGSQIEFTKALMKHDVLEVIVPAPGNEPITAYFNLDGLSNAVKQVRSLCHW